jgi:uncharacterized protein (DUF697 family)
VEDYQIAILLFLTLSCAVTTLITVGLVFAAVFFGFKAFRRFFAPEPEVLEKRFDKLQQRNPNATRDQLVNKIIHQQAMKTAIVGGLTGIGGFTTLPIALPIDILAGLRIQATMVNFIARAYGRTPASSAEETVVAAATMVGAYEGVQFATKFLLQVAEKSVAKVVPLISAPIGFVVNYAIAQAVGRAAIQLYSPEARQRALDQVKQAGEQVAQLGSGSKKPRPPKRPRKRLLGRRRPPELPPGGEWTDVTPPEE